MILVAAGCANFQTTQEWEKLNSFAKERTGVELRWEQTEVDAESIKDAINELLSDGLTEDRAVRIALLNNRKLQAMFEDIGIAKVDLVQAGLFTNPDLTAIFRFPFRGGITHIEGTGIFKISDIWQISLRKRVAAAKLEATIYKVSDEILDTAAEAKHAHNEYIALSMLLHEAKKMKGQMEELKDQLIYRNKFGLERDLDISMASAGVLDHEADVARIGKELQVAKMRLNRVLGLSSQQCGYEVSGALSEQFRQIPDLETLLSFAFSMRPDLQIAKRRVDESQRVLVLERKRLFRDVDAGFAYEHDTDGTDLLGPEVKIQLPFFDQNQAQIAKAEFRLRQAEKELKNKMNVIREEVSAASERISRLRIEISLIKETVLPERKSSVRYAQKYADAMQLNMLYLLEARKKLIETDRCLIEVLRDERNQEIELERLMGSTIAVSEQIRKSRQKN